MKDLKRTLNTGDTLIEVIFAFAILATIIGYAFTGAIQARKTALSAQQRTQAVFIAQEQSQALKAYRDSLPWDDSEGFPNFIGLGNNNGAAVVDYPPASYCVTKVDNQLTSPSVKQWLLLNNTDQRCPSTTLQPAPSEKVVQTSFKCINPGEGTRPVDCNILRATVEVKWIDPYGRESNVINLVNLAKNF
jgi:type II secretory pathway pseudopilin PulG